MAPDHSADRLVAGSALDYSENGPIAKGDLIGLYTSVGWSNYTRNPDLLHRAVENSLWKLSVWDGRELVGLARAVSDDASIAYVQDILVRPDRQRNGIGRAWPPRRSSVSRTCPRLSSSPTTSRKPPPFIEAWE